jgi:hypothetical protein
MTIKDQGMTASGLRVRDELVDKLAKKAEAGYDSSRRSGIAKGGSPCPTPAMSHSCAILYLWRQK